MTRGPPKFSLATAKNQTEALKLLATQTRRSIVDYEISVAARAIVKDGCQGRARDDECELEAIYNAVKSGTDAVDWLRDGVHYVVDSRDVDQFFAPLRLMEMCKRGACAADCLPADTLVLGAGYRMVPIADVRIGDTIMGDGRWVKVTGVWDKGEQDIAKFGLRNGCTLRCTADHRVFRVPKVRRRGGFYSGPRTGAEEVRAGELQVGDDLLTAEALPFGQEGLDADRAWMLGVHVADGWVGYDENGGVRNFSISGKDGHRKEAQKERVKEICSRLGLPYLWHERYIAVNDKAWAAWLASCGRTAINKHLPSMNFDETTVKLVLDGLNADADVRNNVFGSISWLLALQVRLLYRMLGVSTHVTRVDDHGGLGRNPIYRVTPRLHADNKHPHARITSISESEPEHTFDIEVEGHRFYLPESDLVVHNCDDQAAMVCALAGSVGFRVGLYAWGPKDADDYEHVLAVAEVPKSLRPGEKPALVALDTTVESAYVGWKPPPGKYLLIWLN